MIHRNRLHWLLAAAAPCALAMAPACAWAQSIEREAAAIDWPVAESAMKAAANDDKAGVAKVRSSPTSREALDRVALPVLVPGSDSVRASPALFEQGTAYAANYPLDAADLVVLGSASAITLPPGSPLAKLLEGGASSANYQFEAYEYGADLSFVRYGASYVLRLACEEPEDPRCGREEFLRKVADSLIAVGGKRR